MTIGDRIRESRKSSGFTLKNMGEMTGLSIAYLSEIERDQKNPPIDTFLSIASALCVRPAVLLGEGEMSGTEDEWKVTGRVREIVEAIVRRANGGEWVSVDPIFLRWLWADFTKMEGLLEGADK